MSETDLLLALHAQIDRDVAPYVRLALARGEAVEVVQYVAKDGKLALAQVKVKPGKAC